MDKTSVIGFILGIVAVGVGLVIKGDSMSALINPAAILIIIAGTIAAVLIAFPTKTIMKLPSLFKIMFTEKNDMDMYELIEISQPGQSNQEEKDYFLWKVRWMKLKIHF